MTTWEHVSTGLKPFQVATVDTAFEGLWHSGTTSRFLVADEVGLGKTLVAKGVIARTIEHLRSLGEKRIDIVYICSNQTIARQNLLKLKEFADGHEESADRLTKLVGAQGLRPNGVNVISLTPGTSFSFGHRSGRFDERALLYAVVKLMWPRGADFLRKAGAKRIFFYGIGNNQARELSRSRLSQEAAAWRDRIGPAAVTVLRDLFRKARIEREENGRPSIWDEMRELEPAFARRSELLPAELEQRQALLGELRQLLARAGVNLLRPDLVIMDEFQRFADLLDPRSDDQAAQLLRTFISAEHPDNVASTKVLLLSATPYRWFDSSGQGSHHSDFLSTLRFLHGGDQDPVDRTEQALANLRASLRSASPSGSGAAEAAELASIELRRVMVRTERLSSTPDRNGMLSEVLKVIEVEQLDIEGYLAAERLAERLQSPGVVELWKTAPWIANIGDNYKVTDRLGQRVERDRSKFIWNDPSLLDINAVSSFAEIPIPSPRLRWLIRRTVGAGWHRLVWMPPSRPYYATQNEFDLAARLGITKQLVFSSWRIAPKAIALGLTYAAEQQIYGPGRSPSEEDTEWSATRYRSQERTLLDLKVTSEGRADSLTSFMLAAPFSGLAALIDPLSLGNSADGALHTLQEVRSAAASIISAQLAAFDIPPAAAAGDVRWFVYAARLLSPADDSWWARAHPSSFAGDDTKERRALQAHIGEVASITRPSGPPPLDLVEVLVDLALASPAICALRSLNRVLDFNDPAEHLLMDAAARIGWGFRSLLDTSEIIQIIAGDRPYWHSVLDYCAQGNLQAVTDEYVHMLREWKSGGNRDPSEAARIAAAANDALSFRTVTLDARFPGADGSGSEVRKLRSRFAVRFGDKSGDDDVDRKDVTAAAFNSPFWPFVMATTSIGQEGLDFHLYSHALIHWNLPTDPVALEQREGRVHRFKGHAVRKNVAQFNGALDGISQNEDPWDVMFQAAIEPDGFDGIKPFWIYEGDASIERIVPMLPLSREHADLELLKASAATYRMAFGQPRHDDLLEIVGDRSTVANINLAPRRQQPHPGPAQHDSA